MKSYLTEQRIHLVGKAWEVRRFLQVLVRDAASADQTLPHYLAKFKRAGNPGFPATHNEEGGSTPKLM